MSGAVSAPLRAATALAVPDIDWQAPWLRPYAACGQQVAQRWLQQGALPDTDAHERTAQALCTQAQHLQQAHGAGAAVDRALWPTFVPQSHLPRGLAYEQFIFETRQVPTRDNLHDFFNGLVWLQFPHTKRRLNALQAQAIAADGVQPVRGSLRDAITVFDENGAVLHAPPALWAALRARNWQRLFVELRPLWQQARLELFGHALLEKLVSPRKPMVAHVYQGLDAIDFDGSSDVWLSAQLDASTWASKPFAPLPVLGVPGWWSANEEPHFYADAQVFRPPRELPAHG